MEQQNLYIQRMNFVLNHIRSHLAEDLSLDTLAEVACFSPYHFHRIFRAVTGETVNDLVVRLRLERAAALLKASPRTRILDIALECGFNSASSFSRAFKNQFGIAARQWDRQSALKESKNGKVFEGFPQYTEAMLSEVEQSSEFEVRVRTLPEQRMAYIRVTNSYTPPRVMEAYDRLIAWYRAQGGDLSQTTLYGMSQDDPDITPLELCRYDVCLTIPPHWMGAGEVSIRVFPACEIAYLHCEGDIFKVDRAWQYLYRYWLPRSRYQPDNLPAMEIYHRQPIEIGWEVYDLDCAVPVVSL
jgi:AraC family transcriptional regulator